MATKKNDTQKLAEEVQASKKKALETAKTSEIASKFGKRKTVTIAEGTDHEYQITLLFPGTVTASNLVDNSMNAFGNINRTAFMEEAIKPGTGLIVEPQIKSLSFWDTHKGYNEVTNECINFLTDMLNQALKC